MKNDLSFDYVLWKIVWFGPFSLFALFVVIKLSDTSFKNHWNTLIFFDQEKMISDLNISHRKMFDFVSVPLFAFTFVIKLRDFHFKFHWNASFFGLKNWSQIWVDPVETCLILFHLPCTHLWERMRDLDFLTSLKYFWPRKLTPDLNMSCGKIPGFVSDPLFTLTNLMKLRDFGFTSHWNILLFFDWKKWCQIWVCLTEHCLILFNLLSLCSLFAKRWGIQILKFIEML